ncbi:MAG TPA: PhnD/SsuA/transferrin family substrate-binding protein, partial [Alphaproteobacteria bacterium]|nr:PhnD/SsuA/transferrin family substrate-binding protein [Alphaproteobacteria bacterium]
MTRRASLPMYDLPELREATDAWWHGLAAALRREGLQGVPAALTRSPDPATDWTDLDLLLSQACGYPLVHDFADRLQPVATPRYAVPGCEGALYCSRIVVGRASPAERLEDLRGRVCAVNGWDSQSGWNALAAAAASLAPDGRFFAGALVTGSHAASLAAVAEGRAAVAAI